MTHTLTHARTHARNAAGRREIIKEVYGLTVLYIHTYAVKGIIFSHFSRPKVTLKTIAKVNKLDAGTPSCTQPPKPFSIVYMQYSQQLVSLYLQKGQKWPQ